MPPPDNADIQVLGAPQRIVAASQASRLRRDPLGVDVVENGVIPRTVDCEIPIFDTDKQMSTAAAEDSSAVGRDDELVSA